MSHIKASYHRFRPHKVSKTAYSHVTEDKPIESRRYIIDQGALCQTKTNVALTKMRLIQQKNIRE